MNLEFMILLMITVLLMTTPLGPSNYQRFVGLFYRDIEIFCNRIDILDCDGNSTNQGLR
jgi:hypothetical protein